MKSYKDIGCRNCGAVLPMEVSNIATDEKNVWYPGKKCPMCDSQEFYPTIKPSEPAHVNKKKEWKYNPWYGVVAIGIVIIFIPIYFFVLRSSSEGKLNNAMLMCSKCSEVFSSKVSGKPPFICPFCKEKTAYGALYCTYDFVIYPWKADETGQTGFPSCPVCRKTKPELLKNETHLNEVRMKRKQLEEFERKMKDMKNAPK
jgi:hypothetical protein